MGQKPLKQEDYKMKIIEDLGRVLPKEDSKQIKRMAIFECSDCGKHIRIQTQDGKKQERCRSCHAKIANLKHGDNKTRLYRIWSAMKTRATNKNTKTAYRYVLRGITICDEWKNSYEIFKQWAVENGYEDTLTIDRIDNDGNYEPNNCRWVTQQVQMSNTRLDRIDNTSGYRGAYLRKETNKWRAMMTYMGKTVFIADGLKTAKEAAVAYNNYVVENNLPHKLNTL